MSIIEQNVQAWNEIYTAYPLTAEGCEAGAATADWQIREARDGSLFDVLMTPTGSIALQSQYRPIEEAKRYVKQFEGLKKGSCILFLGMGNGYILHELLQYQDVRYICYEPDYAYFCHVMCHYDMTGLLRTDAIKIYVKGLNADRISMDMYCYVNALNWPLFYLDFMPKYQQLYPEEIPYIEQLYTESRTHGYANYGNANIMAKRYMKNAVRDLRYVYRGNSIAQYQDILQEIPVIIVAAGPSLEKNIAYLKQCRDRAFVICVDHAMPMLSKYGIVPHAYMTVDAKKNPAMFCNAGQVPWLVYTTSNPDAIAVLDHPRLIFASTIYAYAEQLFQLAGSNLFQLESGGSVATNAVQAAICMGSRRIILIGQDLALTGNQLYAGVQTKDIAEGLGTLYVKAFDGGEVLTRTDYKSYIDYYKALVARRKDVTFINATEGGAYMEGMQHMTLEAAMEQYGLAEPFDGDALLCRVPELMTPDKQAMLLQEYHGLLSYFKKIKREVKTAITWTERGLRLLEQSSYENPELARVEQEINRFQDSYNSHPGKSILDMGVGREIQDALLDISFTKENLTEELTRLYQKMLIFFQGIASCVAEVIPLLQDVIEGIEKEKQA